MSDDLLHQQAERLMSGLAHMRRPLAPSPSDIAAGLTLPQLRLCVLLREGPLPMTSVARELSISVSAVTQIADRLERTRWVERTIQQDDRRVRLLRLTPRGARLMRQRHRRRVQWARQVLETLEAADRERVLAAVDTLVEASRLVGPEVVGDLLAVAETGLAVESHQD